MDMAGGEHAGAAAAATAYSQPPTPRQTTTASLVGSALKTRPGLTKQATVTNQTREEDAEGNGVDVIYRSYLLV